MNQDARSWLGVSAALVVLALAVPALAGAQPTPPSPQHDRYMIEFRQFGPAAAAVRAAGGVVVHEFPALSVVAAWLTPAAVQALRINPNVIAVEEDPARFPFAQTVPYGIPMVQADQLGEGPAAGNVKGCVIDSGYHRNHIDLSQNVTGTNDSGTGSWFEDACGHGTHVAGTIAAVDNADGVLGVTPNGTVPLHIVKVFGDGCSWTYSSDLIAATDVCAAEGSRIISMSLGGSFRNRFEERQFNQLYNAGVLSVAAAGNNGSTQRSYPASYDSVISVAAIDANKVVADFSQKNSQVELAAPGVAVLSTVPWLETNTLTVGTVTYSGNWIEGAARTLGTLGILADGGMCASSGDWGGKIVLCQRGDISFAAKVGNVESGGGVAAVVYNNVSSDSSCGDFLGTLNGTSGIPAISVSCSEGADALTRVGSEGTVVSQRQEPGSGYEEWNGTSMATPHVSGVAALVWSHNAGWTNADIRQALQQTAEDLGTAGRDNSYGYGLVQAKAALCQLEPLNAACGAGGGGGLPTASFTFSCSGLTCTFIDTSTDSGGTIVSWSWTFGDGTGSAEQNPAHTYGAGASYTVALTVTDNDGNSDDVSQVVTVSDGASSIALDVVGYKIKGVKHADLTWSGATSTNIDVYRDGAFITTTPNDGVHTDNIGTKGGGTYTYKVCEAGTATCSPEKSITF